MPYMTGLSVASFRKMSRNNFQLLLLVFLAIANALLSGPLLSSAFAEGAVPRNRHPWGRFAIGSWKRVRVQIESLDENGQVTGTSTTETTTTLVDVDKDGYTLHIEVTIEVAGRRRSATPQIIKQGFNGEPKGQQVSYKIIGNGSVTIAGSIIPSEIRQTIVNGGNTRRVTTVHYSDRIAPFVLKLNTTITDLTKQETKYQTEVEVIAVAMPCKVLAEMMTTSHIKTIHKQPHGSEVTLEVQSINVPGGVVSHSSKQMNDKGQVVRRSTLELLDFGIGEDQDDRRKSRRRVVPRNQKRLKTSPR